jgi:hypothetical protein
MGCCRVEHKRERSLAVSAEHARTNDDQIVVWIEPANLHRLAHEVERLRDDAPREEVANIFVLQARRAHLVGGRAASGSVPGDTKSKTQAGFAF